MNRKIAIAIIAASAAAAGSAFAEDYNAYNPVAASSKTRAQVVGEYLASRDRVAAFTGEDSGSAYLARNGAGTDTQRFARSR